MFDFASSMIPIRRDLAVAFRAAWHRLGAPGTWWTGNERVALAEIARRAYANQPSTDSSLPRPAQEAAAILGKTPAAVTAGSIASWEAQGLDAGRYVELVSVVAMTTAIDTFHRGLDLELEPLPTPQPGEPSHSRTELQATKTKAWVPMVGPPTIPTSLSAVPAEMEALESLHGPMYLSYQEMSDPAIQRGLSRAQMELVAGRTSAINECFF